MGERGKKGEKFGSSSVVVDGVGNVLSVGVGVSISIGPGFGGYVKYWIKSGLVVKRAILVLNC